MLEDIDDLDGLLDGLPYSKRQRGEYETCVRTHPSTESTILLPQARSHMHGHHNHGSARAVGVRPAAPQPKGIEDAMASSRRPGSRMPLL